MYDKEGKVSSHFVPLLGRVGIEQLVGTTQCVESTPVVVPVMI